MGMIVCMLCGVWHENTEPCPTGSMGNNEFVITPSGAKTSDNLPPFWEMPLAAMEAYARRLKVGHRYGIMNWRKGLSDVEFVRDRMNHLIKHLMMVANGIEEGDNTTPSNIDAVVWGAGFLAEVQAKHPETIKKAFYSECRYEKV